MIHYYNYRPEQNPEPEQDGEETKKQPQPKRHWLRRLLIWALISAAVIAAAGVLLGAIVYAYVSQVPLDNTGGRTNILVLGVDEVASLSDTILLVSIKDSPGQPKEVALTNIPRDLYVDIPGSGGHKINAAHSLGESNGHSDGGPGLTADTIEEEFDMPVHYYAALDFESFEKIIDSLGGVEVKVKTSIDDPYYPAPGYDGYDPFSIEEGTHELDGETALKYARSRKTTSDFDRSFRQQQIALAVKNKALNPDSTLGYLRTFRMLQVVEAHAETNLNSLEKVKLGSVFRGVGDKDIKQYVIDTSNFLTSDPYTGSLVPRTDSFEEIQEFMENIFTQSEIDEYSSPF